MTIRVVLSVLLLCRRSRPSRVHGDIDDDDDGVCFAINMHALPGKFDGLAPPPRRLSIEFARRWLNRLLFTIAAYARAINGGEFIFLVYSSARISISQNRFRISKSRQNPPSIRKPTTSAAAETRNCKSKVSLQITQDQMVHAEVARKCERLTERCRT